LRTRTKECSVASWFWTGKGARRIHQNIVANAAPCRFLPQNNAARTVGAFVARRFRKPPGKHLKSRTKPSLRAQKTGTDLNACPCATSIGSGAWIRTNDLRVMSSTTCDSVTLLPAAGYHIGDCLARRYINLHVEHVEHVSREICCNLLQSFP